MDTVRSWKDPFYRRRGDAAAVENPVGEVLLEDELDEVIGGKYMEGSGSTGFGCATSWGLGRFC